jgi:ketosteroid isomerase-like protein
MQRTLALVLALVAATPLPMAKAQPAQSFAATSAATQRNAEAYFAAYIARDWDKLALHLAEEGGFSDPTATPVFGKVEVAGKQATLKYFRENYAAIKAMRFNRTRAFFSGSHAVFEGTLDWTLGLQGGKEAVTVGMPFVTILRLDAGLVLEHRDFADYQPFIVAQRKAASGE